MVLKLVNVSKSFGNYHALKSVSLEVNPGEIHGLVGENGAGKSTLLGVLFGNSNITTTGGYSGEVLVGGKKVVLKSPSQAVRLGIGMVHQEFALIPHMTVMENINIGREHIFPLSRRFLGESLACIDWRKNQQEAEKVLKRLGMRVDPRLKAIELSVNFRQFIEIAREIKKDNLKILVMDEPTSALTEEETKIFFSVIQEIAARGTAIVFVSHRLDEITALCHKVTVLRDGQVVAVYARDQFDIQAIALDMVGKDVIKTIRGQKYRSNIGKVLMKLENFSVGMPGETIRGVDLEIKQGEILGLAGLSGHGKLALGNGVMGVYPSSGSVCMNKEEINPPDTRGTINKGIFYLPDDRRYSGLLLDHSILENIVFSCIHLKGLFLKPFFIKSLSLMDNKRARGFAESMVGRLDIRCRGIDQKVKYLSGGNQQKVCLARALSMDPRLLFISEPTRGIDVGAKEIILETILGINQDMGTTIVLASSELGELKRVCDRIAIFYEGHLSNIFSPEKDEVDFALAFSGEKVASG